MLALVASVVFAKTAPAQAAPRIGRVQYAAEVHRVDSPLVTLDDAFYLFTGGKRTVGWATEQTVLAERQVGSVMRRLAQLTRRRESRGSTAEVVSALDYWA